MQSIGERLIEARKRKGITVREAAEVTKIRGEYLDNFENNIFKINIPDIYIRGFLRNYATYLQVNADKIITDYNAHLLGESKSPRRENREIFGRLEFQQQASSEESKDAGQLSDESVQKENDPSTLVSIWEKLNIEKEVAIKIGIAVLLGITVIFAMIWGVLAFLSSEEPVADTHLTETRALAPAIDATPFTLVANGDVRVDIKTIDGDRPIFFDSLSRGQEIELQATGSIRIYYNDAAALSIRIGTDTYQMPSNKTSIRITPSTILAKQQSGN